MNNNLITNEIASKIIDETNTRITSVIINESNNEFNTNCLALTIRKDYRFTIFSNVVNTVKHVSLKVLANLGMLNFLTMLF